MTADGPTPEDGRRPKPWNSKRGRARRNAAAMAWGPYAQHLPQPRASAAQRHHPESVATAMMNFCRNQRRKG